MTNLAAAEAATPQEVTKLELFFDLVYVFAISQLSGHLAEHLTWRGALETLVLLLTIFTIWSFTTYESTMVLARSRRTRWVLLTTMILGLVMNASITGAFSTTPWSFVIPMLIIQLGRSAITRHYDIYDELRRHRTSMIIWAISSAIPWVLGAMVEEHQRLWFWCVAAAIDVIGMWTHHPVPGRRMRDFAQVGFDHAHQVERCRLFLLICLGEAIIRSGEGMAHNPQDPARLLAGGLSMLVLICVWYVFFGAGDEEVDDHFASDSRRALQMGELATNGQQVLVIAFVAYAVGTEAVVGDAGEHLPVADTALLFGGMAICLGAFGTFLGRLTGRVVWPPLLTAIPALVIGAVIVWAAWLTGLAAVALLAAIMVATAAWFVRDVERNMPRATAS